VARPVDVTLDEHVVGSERALRLALARRERGTEIRNRVDATHAFAAAPSARLDEHGITDARGLGGEARGILIVAVVAGRSGTSNFSINALATAFDPMARMASALGPTKTTPCAAHASASAGFSERNP